MLYELHNLKKQFGTRTVLDIDILELDARKVYALIGPNGAGKTTLLNHLAFLDRQSSGVLKFRNNVVTFDQRNLVNLRRQVILVDQSPILFSGTVSKNVEFGLKVRGLPKPERALKIEMALERVGMEHLSRQYVHGLSGGEVKRVALARALAVNPDVLLCDEPTANVDQENQEVILKILEDANSTQHTSVIFTTHYLSQSRRLADQTILLQNGRISFENSENTFDVTIIRIHDNLVRLHLRSGEHHLLAEVRTRQLKDGKARVKIAADKLILHDPQSVNSGQQRFAVGEIRKIENSNDKIRVLVDVGTLINITMELPHYKKAPPLVGQSVAVEIPENAISIS